MEQASKPDQKVGKAKQRGAPAPTVALASNPAEPIDTKIPGVAADPMPAHGYLTEEAEKKKPALDPKLREAVDNMTAAAETAVLVSTMGKVGDREGRWKFLNTLDRVDDPNVRKKMAAQFELQTGQKLGDFVENAGWHSKRDKEQAKDLISDERGEVETKLAELEQKSPAAFKAREHQAKEWATKILNTTRADDVDDDKSAKAIFDTLGQRTPEEIELIRRQIREISGGRSAYQEIDKSLSGGTEDEALAGLKGNKVTSVAAGIKNADGNADRIQELLRRLNPVEIAELKKTNPMIDLIAIQSVDGGQRAEIAALLEGNKAKANAAQITDLFKDPRDGLDMDGIKLTKQSEQNLENRKTENVIKALRDMPPADIRAAKVAWEKDPANQGKTWDSMIEARFGDGDSTTLMRIRALADGNKVEERAYALRDAMRTQNQEEIEAAIASPDLHSDDPMKRSIAIAERFELEQRVRALDEAAVRTTAAMTGKDPNAVVGRDMQHQLNDYYREYGDKVPHPKDFTSMRDVMSDIDEVKEKRAAKANEDSIAAGELEQQGKLSTTTQVRRAEVKGDLEHKAQLLENLGSARDRVEVEKDFEARYGKSVYEDPRAAQFHAAAKFLKERGDDRPLSEIEIDVANKERNANEHRVHNVQIYGAKAERDPYVQYLLQKEQFERQHSDSLEAEEVMREMRGRNAGIEDLNRHNLAAMEQQFVAETNPFDMTPRALKDGVTREDFDAHDKSVTNTLEVQRTEKMKHGERLAMAFSTIAKIGALLAGQPHLVFLIDAAAGLTEMAIKSSTMGNDYDSSLDEKMFGLTMAVDVLTMGAGKYFSGAANKLDDVVAAERAGANAATEIAEQAVTSEAKKEIAEDAIKQVAKGEAKLASGIAKSADDGVEGGMAMAKTEQAIAKVEGEVAETAAETAAETSVEKAVKTLQRQEMAVNMGIGAANTVGAGMIQGEASGDMAFGVLRGLFGSLLPVSMNAKIDKLVGQGKMGSALKYGMSVLSDVTVGGNDLKFAVAGAHGNHLQAKKAQKAVGAGDDHVMSHHAEEPTYRPGVDDDGPTVTKPVADVDPHVLANGHNAEADHLLTTGTRARVDEEPVSSRVDLGPDIPLKHDAAAARAIPGGSFHGNARGTPDPPSVQTRANESIAKHAGRVGGVPVEDGAIEITLADGSTRRIKVVTEQPSTAKDAPVARYDATTLGERGEIVIYVSDQAAEHHISRAVAHDLAEIRHRLQSGPDGSDALAPGSTETKLSSHDVGRLAEIDVLADEIRQARRDDNTSDVERIQRDARELMDHLGLTSPGALDRRSAIDSHRSGASEFGHQSIRRLQEIIGKEEINKHLAHPQKPQHDRGAEVAELTKASQAATKGKGSAREFKALIDNADADHFTPEEKARLQEFRDKVAAGKDVSKEVEGIHELIKANAPADPELLAIAKARANLEALPAGAGAEHAAYPALEPSAGILDSQLVLALEKESGLSDAEKKYVEQLAGGTHHATDFVLAGEPGGAKPARPPSVPNLGNVPITVPRDSPEYEKVLDVLVRYNVGRTAGSGDQTIVADAFFARTSTGDAATLKTADEGIISGLLRASGRNPEKMTRAGGSFHDAIQAEGGSFDVKLHGKTLKVVVIASE